MPTILDRIHSRTRPQPYRSDGQPEADFELWENGDDIPVPKVSMDANDGLDDDESGPGSQTDDYGNMPNANPTSYDRYRGAIEKKAAWEQTRPGISDHKPKGWQRALAGAANFGAGYVNAGGRVRVDPKAMESINSSLLRPGYQRDMEKWSDQAGRINAEVDATGREMQMDNQQTRARLDAERATAYNANQNAQASRARRQEQEIGRRKWMSSDGLNAWRENEDGTGIEKREIRPPSPGRPVPETKAEEKARLLKESREVMGHKDGSDEQKAYLGDFAAKERLKAANRPARGGGRGRAEPRRIGTPGEFNGVRKDKVSALQKLEADLSKQLEELNTTYPGDGDDPTTKNLRVEWQKKHDKEVADHEAKKKMVMAEYDAGVTGLGGSVVPRQATAAPPPSAPAGGGEVRVMLPNGKEAILPNEQAAKAYKLKYGLK